MDVVRVGAKRRMAPGVARGSLVGPSATTERFEPLIREAARLERGFERGRRILWQSPRAGKAAHIRDVLDVVGAEHRHELVEWPDRVPDGPDGPPHCMKLALLTALQRDRLAARSCFRLRPTSPRRRPRVAPVGPVAMPVRSPTT